MTLRPVPGFLPRSVPRPSRPPPAVPPPEALVHAGRASSEEWEMAGRRCRVRLTGLGGVRSVVGDDEALTGALTVADATGANVLLGPRCTRRECYRAGVGLGETVLVPDGLPGVVLQWSGTAAVEGEMTVLLELLPGLAPGEVPVHVGPGLAWAGRGGRGVIVLTPGTESVPEIETGGEGDALVARLRLPLPSPGAPVTLLVSAAPESGEWASLTALAGVTAHHRRGEIMAAGEGEVGLRLDTGVEPLDRGVQWCRSWLRDRLRTEPGRSPAIHGTVLDPGAFGPFPEGCAAPGTEAAWIAWASAAGGDWEVGRAALGQLGWESPWTRLLSALALARWTAWTGETRPLEVAEARLRECFGESGPLGRVPLSLRDAVGEAVAEAMEAATLDPLEVAPRDRELSRERADVPPGPRTLPMAGSGHAPTSAFLGLGPPTGPDEPLAAPVRVGLERLVGDPGRLGTGEAAWIIPALVEGILGARPDAVYGRLGLAPALPSHWTAFQARGIRTGEGTIQLGYRRSGGTVEWELRPRQGSVPLMAVFSPWIPLERVERVRVDGEEAELELEGRDGWTRLHLQIPVDGIRRVEVEGPPTPPAD